MMSSNKNILRAFAVAAALFVGTPSVTLAVPVRCVDGAGLACVAKAGDILAGGHVLHNSGNDKEDAVEAALESALGDFVDLVLYGKSDDDAALFLFSNFDSGSSLEDSKSGNWSVLDGTAISYITVKAANSFIIFSAGNLSSGLFSTLGILNNGGKQPEVSHISFWTTDAEPNTHSDVPEPATAALLLSGLVAAGRLRKSAARK